MCFLLLYKFWRGLLAITSLLTSLRLALHSLLQMVDLKRPNQTFAHCQPNNETHLAGQSLPGWLKPIRHSVLIADTPGHHRPPVQTAFAPREAASIPKAPLPA